MKIRKNIPSDTNFSLLFEQWRSSSVPMNAYICRFFVFDKISIQSRFLRYVLVMMNCLYVD